MLLFVSLQIFHISGGIKDALLAFEFSLFFFFFLIFVCCVGSSVSSLKEQCSSKTHVLKHSTIPFVAVRVCMVHRVQTKELISLREGSLGSNSEGLFNKVLLIRVDGVPSFAQ